MARPGSAAGSLNRLAIAVDALSCGKPSALISQWFLEVRPELSTVYSQLVDNRLTPAPNQPLAGQKDREHRSLAERDCGAGGRRSWKRPSGQPSEQKASPKEGPGRPGTEFRAAPAATDTERGQPRETEAQSTLKAQIPQRIWMRGRRTGRPERRPLAIGRMPMRPVLQDWSTNHANAALIPASARAEAPDSTATKNTHGLARAASLCRQGAFAPFRHFRGHS